MRRAFLATLTLAALVMFAGCSDQEPTSPAEPSFGKRPSTDCLDETSTGELRDVIRADIGNLFADKKTKKTAGEQINNIERKLCKEPPQYDDATNMAWDFLRFTNDKIPNKVIGVDPPAAAAELTSKVFALAAEGDPLVIPEEAFGDNGGIGEIDPTTGGTVTANNEQAAVVANSNSFAGTDPVTIVLTRIPDPDVQQPPGSGPIPGYQAYPEGWDIMSSQELTPPGDGGSGAIIELCVVTDGLNPAVDARLVIGHDLGGGQAELLFPRLATENVDCTNATSWPPPVASASPVWLNLARRLVEPAKRLFGPKPLNAMYFGGRGLGGRTTSFTNFSPVDPWSLSVTPESATIDVSGTVSLLATISGPPEDPPPVDPVFSWASDNAAVATVDTDGLVTGVGSGTATITVTHDVLEATSEITVILVFNTLTVEITGGFGQITGGGGIVCTAPSSESDQCSQAFENWVTVSLIAVPASGYYLSGWTGDCTFTDDTNVCLVDMDTNQTVTAAFLEPEM